MFAYTQGRTTKRCFNSNETTVNCQEEKEGCLMCNRDIRAAAAGAGVRLWKIAAALNINDGNFSRKLRRELPDEEKQRIFGIIEKLSKEVG